MHTLELACGRTSLAYFLYLPMPCTCACTADRAKSIKTKAVVNESATDKLIRELREENARLLEMLKQGGGGTSSTQAQPALQQEVDPGQLMQDWKIEYDLVP